jgi:hypothetical protein
VALITDIGFEFEAGHFEGGPIEGPPRSPGMHVSRIIADIYNSVISPGERTPFDHLPPDEKSKMLRYRELGFVWEEQLERMFKRRMVAKIPTDNYITQEEILHDGVYMTPDGVYMDGDDWSLLEFKLTWKSARKTTIENVEGEMWEWVTQMKAYCHALHVTSALLFVFHVNGTYAPSVPLTRGLEFTFSEEELHDNWTMLSEHAKTMTAPVVGGDE